MIKQKELFEKSKRNTESRLGASRFSNESEANKSINFRKTEDIEVNYESPQEQ